MANRSPRSPVNVSPVNALRERYHAHLVSPRSVEEKDAEGGVHAKQDGRREGRVASKETRRGMRAGAEWATLTLKGWEALGQAWLLAPQDVFVWSDLHLQHENIIRYAQRPFGGVFHMDNGLLVNAQAAVRPEQWLVFVGDVAMWRDRDTITAWMANCPGRKALVLGNHDVRGRERPMCVEDWQAMGFEAVADVAVLPAAHGLPDLWITHYPLPTSAIPRGTLNVHGHLHTHGLPGAYVNVCVENVGYTPRNLREWVKGKTG